MPLDRISSLTPGSSPRTRRNWDAALSGAASLSPVVANPEKADIFVWAVIIPWVEPSSYQEISNFVRLWQLTGSWCIASMTQRAM